MAKKMVSPIMTWVFWGILVLGVFLLVTWEYFVAGFTADASKISYLIVAFFVYGFFASLRIAYYLQAEFTVLEVMESNQRVGNANSSDAAALFDAALERIRRGDRIDMRNLVSSYGIRIKARVDNISVISSMLITIGLLGTVIGLIITVTGLGHVLSASGSDYAAMKAGLNQTVSGMGTAFYTTFFGALLGGVVLKVLGAEMKKSATQLVADTLRFSELFVVPQLSQNSSEALADLESKVVVLGGQLQQLGGSFSSVIDLIDSKQQALASGLGDLVAMVGESSRQANERMEALAISGEQACMKADERMGSLMASVDRTVEETNRLADERLGAIVSTVEKTVEETNRLADERLAAVADTVAQSVAHTNRQADERIEALVSASTATVEETHRLADERLGALTSTIDKTTEETHRLADKRLAALVSTIEKTTQETHRQANEHLIDLVDTVGQSIEQTRQQAEAQLGAKASDLAQKLNEAASVLAALAVPEEKPANESPGE